MKSDPEERSSPEEGVAPGSEALPLHLHHRVKRGGKGDQDAKDDYTHNHCSKKPSTNFRFT